MRICRFDSDRLGLVVGSDVVDVSGAIERLPAVRWPYPPGDPLIAHWNLIAPEIQKLAQTGERKPIASVRLRSPIASPTKIIGIARNRKNLSGETPDAEVVGQSRKDGDPCHMFIKANSAIAGPSDGVELRFLDRRTDPEVELSIVIGTKGTDIPRERAFDHVFGYTIGLDMSLRGSESPSSRKSIDSYALLGPWIVTRDEISDPDNLESGLTVNDQLLQKANTRDFAFDVRSVIAHASTFYTLHPGDVIMAGTPAMFGRVVPGDRMVTEFEGIGRMDIAVRGHAAPGAR